MSGWNNNGWNDNNVDKARAFYISMGGNPGDEAYIWGDKVELEIAAIDLGKNKSQSKMWHNENNANQDQDVDESNILGKIIIGLVFVAILF